jgi:hypothetical protein
VSRAEPAPFRRPVPVPVRMILIGGRSEPMVKQ